MDRGNVPNAIAFQCSPRFQTRAIRAREEQDSALEKAIRSQGARITPKL